MSLKYQSLLSTYILYITYYNSTMFGLSWNLSNYTSCLYIQLTGIQNWIIQYGTKMLMIFFYFYDRSKPPLSPSSSPICRTRNPSDPPRMPMLLVCEDKPKPVVLKTPSDDPPPLIITSTASLASTSNLVPSISNEEEPMDYILNDDGSCACKLCGEVLVSRTHWYRHKYKVSQ